VVSAKAENERLIAVFAEGAPPCPSKRSVLSAEVRTISGWRRGFDCPIFARALVFETRNSILPPNQLSDGRGFEAMAGELRLRVGVHNLSDGQVTAFRDAYRQMMSGYHFFAGLHGVPS
jgi:hypothetical protein